MQGGSVCLGMEYRLHGAANSEESLRVARNSMGPAENIPYQPIIINDLADIELASNEAATHGLEAWTGGGCGLKGINEEQRVINRRCEEVETANYGIVDHEHDCWQVVESGVKGIYEEQLLTRNKSYGGEKEIMGGPHVVSGALPINEEIVGGPHVVSGALPINEELISHLPSIKEKQSKVGDSFGPTLDLGEMEHSGARVVGKEVGVSPRRAIGEVNVVSSVVGAPTCGAGYAILAPEKLDGVEGFWRGLLRRMIRKWPVFEVNEVNHSSSLISPKVPNVEVDKNVPTDVPFDATNLVDVRVDQAVFLVQRT
ncbi:hypothetical protein ACSQ67_010530 [Phaseolus vulgaris]